MTYSQEIFTPSLGGRILRGSQNFGVSAIFAKLSLRKWGIHVQEDQAADEDTEERSDQD